MGCAHLRRSLDRGSSRPRLRIRQFRRGNHYLSTILISKQHSLIIHSKSCVCYVSECGPFISRAAPAQWRINLNSHISNFYLFLNENKITGEFHFDIKHVVVCFCYCSALLNQGSILPGCSLLFYFPLNVSCQFYLLSSNCLVNLCRSIGLSGI